MIVQWFSNILEILKIVSMLNILGEFAGRVPHGTGPGFLTELAPETMLETMAEFLTELVLGSSRNWAGNNAGNNGRAPHGTGPGNNAVAWCRFQAKELTGIPHINFVFATEL